MKKSCLYFNKKIQMCILHSPLHRSYLKQSCTVVTHQSVLWCRKGNMKKKVEKENMNTLFLQQLLTNRFSISRMILTTMIVCKIGYQKGRKPERP